MRRLTAGIFAAALIAAVPGWAQQEQGANGAHPQPVIQGQSTTPVAPPGGIDQAGVATPPAPASAESAAPLPPGPPAGAQRAAELSNVDLVAGGVAITAVVVCALACFSRSTSTTTSTTPVHR